MACTNPCSRTGILCPNYRQAFSSGEPDYKFLLQLRQAGNSIRVAVLLRCEESSLWWFGGERRFVWPEQRAEC